MSAPETTAVVLMNLGGPDSLEAVEPFLRNIFADPDVVQLPLGRLYQGWLARRIARSRAPESRRCYERIGGRSPILELTRQQAAALQERLGPGFRTYVAMRAWKPTTAEAVQALIADRATRVVALPCYPHRSRTTTVSSLRELKRELAARAPELPLHEVCCYPLSSRLLDAWAERIGEVLRGLPEDARAQAYLLFSAHGLPRKLIDRGDPYLAHTLATVQGVMQRLGSHLPYSLAFQSRATRVEWLTPSTQDALADLASRGVREVLVVPISFLTDHVETLYELDMLIREHAQSVGITGYHRVPALNDSEALIDALEAEVRAALGQVEPRCGAPAGAPPCTRV